MFVDRPLVVETSFARLETDPPMIAEGSHCPVGDPPTVDRRGAR